MPPSKILGSPRHCVVWRTATLGCRAYPHGAPVVVRHVRMGNGAPPRQRCDATNISGPKPLRDRIRQHNVTPSVGRVDQDTRTEPGNLKRFEDAPCPTNGGDRAWL